VIESKTYSSSSSWSENLDIDRATLARASVTALVIESIEGRPCREGTESGAEGRLGRDGGEKLGSDGGEGIFGMLGSEGAFKSSFLMLGNGILDLQSRTAVSNGRIR
jgi:hypothetical protein